jgi:transglutaminase-like putative cysteine protease
MTAATATRPVAARSGGRTAAARQVAFDRDLAATLALTAYSFVVAVGFARVFSGWDFLGDLGLLVVAGHGGSFAMRRMRVSGWVALPAMAVGLIWILAAYQYGSTFAVVPWSGTWEQFRLDITVVQDQFQTAVAPVVYDVGWAALAGLAMVLVIVMADAFAFRAEARGEALVPGGVLFIFIAALGSPRLRVGATVCLVAAGIVAVVALRAVHDRSRRVELATARRSSRTLPASLAMAGLVALAAGWVGPRLPGAGSEPLYETRGRGGGVTEVVSPLVDIRSRLVNQGNVELFRVNADREAYWRVTTLSDFDGTQFELPRTPLRRVDEDASSDGIEIRQQIQILSLSGRFLPAAADPQAVLPNEDIRLDVDRTTLVKTSDLEPEELYTIVSRTPDVTPEILRATTSANAPDAIFTQLPDDFPDSVADLAAQVTAGATTDYDRVMALQGYFQTFDYSTEVQAGHGSSAIENFLRIKEGYCEQFSATLAAMARTLGIPSRVAVGYTPGILRSDGWYSVLGRNSHAWPEIWFDGVGWVPFEPTPSRGIPGATDYTGLEPTQDTTPPQQVGDARDARPVPPTPTTVFRPPTTNAPLGVDDPDARPRTGTPEAPAEVGADTPGGLPWWPFALLALLAFGACAPAAARRWRSRARRHHATPERVAAAWRRACRDVERAGVDGAPSMTTHEWAAATARQLPVAARPMASLAGLVDRVEYSRPGAFDVEDTTNGSVGNDCELWAGQVERIAVDTMPATKKAARYFSEWN